MEGEVDPIRDLGIINEELRLKDEEYFMKIYEEVERKYVRGGEKKLKADYVSVEIFLLIKTCMCIKWVHSNVP